MIYLDNAATSFPKPPEVIKTVDLSMKLYGANPGRSGHKMSVDAAFQVYKCREILDSFFNGYGAELVSFFPNCTYALNTAIKGIVKKGDHIIISSLEHNSVLRPVHKLKEEGVAEYSVFKVAEAKEETLENFRQAFKGNTKLCVVTAVSNVFGNILPLKELSEIVHEKNAFFFVDGAQGAGVVELDMKKQGIDCLCIPGHKGLLGPMGTGALLHKNLPLSSIIEGGTGTASFDFSQPEMYPEKLESGTLNVPGICGLKKGVEIISKRGVNNVFLKESRLCRKLFWGLREIPGIQLYQGDYNTKVFAPLVSFNVVDLHSEQVSAYLSENGIAVRGGFHCAPLAHISNKTQKQGAVRVSPSFFNEEKDINFLLNLVRKIAIYRNI